MSFELPGRTPARIRAELDEEFTFHLEARTAQLVAEGLEPDAARRAALAEFGDLSLAQQRCAREDLARERDRRRTAWLGDLRLDVVHALRALRRRPAFTAAAALTLALGIGGTSALFSAVYGVLLRPLPYADAGRIVTVWQTNPTGGQFDRPSPGNFLDLRDRSRTIAPMAAAEPSGMDLTGAGDPVGLDTWRVTEHFFDVMGAAPALGRTFRPGEFAPGGPAVVVLSDAAWRRHFGGDPSIVGRRITLDAIPHEVVGVLRPDFRYPTQGQLWVPRALTEADRARRAQTYYTVVGRLAPGTALAAARGEIAAVGANLVREYPRINTGVRFDLIPLPERLSGRARGSLLLLLGAVGFVLLIACGNVAALLFARRAEQQRELAVRAALGAGRARLVRQLLTETLVVAAAGGALGLGLATLLVGAIRRWAPATLPRVDDITIGWWTIVFAVAITLAAGLGCGMWPALAGTRSLAADVRGRAARTGRTRDVLVAGEVALALVLLIAAGLLLRSFAHLLQVDLGFDPGRRVAATLHVWDRVPDVGARAEFFRRLDERLAQTPGIRAAGAASSLPLSAEGSEMDPPFLIEGAAAPAPGTEPTALYTIVTPGFFRAMGLGLRRGRLLDARDAMGAPRVAVVNEAMARRYWDGAEVLGARIRGAGVRDSTSYEIVGVVADVRRSGHESAAMAEYYVPHAQHPRAFGSMSIVAEGAVSATVAGHAVQTAVWELLPGQTFAVEELDRLLADTLAPRRFGLGMLAAFALTGLLLALVGIYGLVSVTVAQRMREMGVRMALGATPARLVREVTARAVRLAAAGIVVGLLLALATSRALRALLVGVSPADPLTFGLVAVLALAAAAVASWSPARRAARIDPVRAMRADG